MKWEVSDFSLFAEFINVWQNSRFTSFRIIELEIEKKTRLVNTSGQSYKANCGRNYVKQKSERIQMCCVDETLKCLNVIFIKEPLSLFIFFYVGPP